jgi:hypothetical protein
MPEVAPTISMTFARQPTCDNFVLARHLPSVSRVNAVGHGLPGQRPSATNSVDQLSAVSHGLLPIYHPYSAHGLG